MTPPRSGPPSRHRPGTRRGTRAARPDQVRTALTNKAFLLQHPRRHTEELPAAGPVSMTKRSRQPTGPTWMTDHRPRRLPPNKAPPAQSHLTGPRRVTGHRVTSAQTTIATTG